MCIKIIFNQIKFDIDITNDELLKTIWKHKKKKQSIISSSAQQCEAPSDEILKTIYENIRVRKKKVDHHWQCATTL